MRRITGRISLLILSVLDCLFIPRAEAQNAAPDAAAAHRRNVLILYTYSKDLPWRLAIDDGLKSVVGSLSDGAKPFLFEETVDQSRLGMGPADSATWKTFLSAKYRKIRLDAIVAESQEAARIALDLGDTFPGSERYILNYTPGGTMPTPPPDVHAFSAASNLGQALSTIPLVLPRTKRIVAVLDRTPVNRERADKLRDLATKMAPGITVEIWNEYAEEDLYRRAIALNRNEDAILLFPVLAFPDGSQAVPAEVARKLSQASAAPVFSHFDTLLGTGIVGGYMVSGRALGRMVGELAAFGDQRVPMSQEGYAAASMGYYFDGRVMRRWGIDRSALPADSRILFDEKTFLERYGLLLALIVLVFIAESVLVLSLVRATRRLRFAMGELTEERAHLEERVQERTAEKELLLKELQHRVKNSMALITSLVRLEASGMEDPGAVEALNTLDSRIAALATLYDTLWSSGEVSDIDLGSYLGRILADLDRSLGADAKRVAFVHDLQSIRFDTKRGIPVGLITNELVTNSLKRAFPDGRPGRISVQLRIEGEEAVLEVADDGVGLPLGFDPDLSGGFGMRLIQVLCVQLGADFSYRDAHPGALFTIRIPYRRAA